MNIVPFDKKSMPANIGSGRFDTTPTLVVSGGFPVISIKGKVFHIVKGDEKTFLTRTDQDGDEVPAPSIEVILINANVNVSKIYYSKSYEDGDDSSPDCYSINGDRPEPDSADPQCKTCAACPNNVWGSRITDAGTKAKLCSDARRVAVANPDALGEPFLLRVPPTSLKPLGEYQAKLSKHGAALQEVVTKVGFDPSMAYPTLTFKPVGFLSDPADLDKVEDMMNDPVVLQIIGKTPSAAVQELNKNNLLEEDGAEEEMEDKTPAAKKKAPAATAKKKAAAAAAEQPDLMEIDEEEEEEVPTPPKKAPAKRTPKTGVETKSKAADTGEPEDLVAKAMTALDEFDEFDGFNGFDD